ncbi:DUF2695 domain-containing protein [Pseudonocardia aurantiaca]|uniref:DUF2695 domain-containing protein n=1 Tax=Pseudonocardia aurantiaca TaxID=75290 RepID=A0ABW4FPR1_9PSEU
MTSSFSNWPWDRDQEFDDWDDDMPPRAPALALTAEQQSALAAAVARGLDKQACDNTLRAARQWAVDGGVDWPSLQAQLEGNGGYCDCEVLLNVPGVSDDEPEPV